MVQSLNTKVDISVKATSHHAWPRMERSLSEIMHLNFIMIEM